MNELPNGELGVRVVVVLAAQHESHDLARLLLRECAVQVAGTANAWHSGLSLIEIAKPELVIADAQLTTDVRQWARAVRRISARTQVILLLPEYSHSEFIGAYAAGTYRCILPSVPRDGIRRIISEFVISLAEPCASESESHSGECFPNSRTRPRFR